jgi:pyocin large subunit-like protein
MSVAAVNWAFGQANLPSSMKFTLIAMCHYADSEKGIVHLPIANLCEITGQNRKTVISNISGLRDGGYIADAGIRNGRTGQIKAYAIVFENALQ